MSRVLFIMKYPIEETYSVTHKFDGQMEAVKNLGHEVYYISFDKNHLYLNHNNQRETIKKTTFGNSRLYYHLISFYDIYSAALKVMKDYSIDIVYLRYGPLNTVGSTFLKVASLQSTIVVEIPTFPTSHEKQKNVFRAIYMHFSEKHWKKSANYIDLFTIIGENAKSYLDTPTLNIDNGVFVEAVPLRKKAVASDGKKHMLAVASMSDWQGYDRIIRGLAEWESPKAKDYIIDLVGEDGDGSLEEWIRLSESLGIRNQVHVHGKLTGEPLSSIFTIADIGLGSLGMYRKRMSHGSILKLREYMARGLPFLYAYDDSSVSPDMPWCIQFPNDNSSIDMEVVDNFIDCIKDDNNIGVYMRNYAIEHMSWEAQFKQVFDRIKQITGRCL